MGELDGKSALILGASSQKGIGESIARLFAKEGAKVIVSARRAEPLEALARDIGGEAIACDISSEEEVKKAVAYTVETNGSIDIAVNAAGVNLSAPIAEITPDMMQTACDVHLIGPTMFIKHVAAAMEKGGSIMTMSSLTAELTGARLGAYASTKTAADKMVQIAALEYGNKGIRVNSLAPGLVRTPMTEQFFSMPNIVSAFEKETALGEIASADEVAFAALYLASDRCKATGDIIRVSSGAHLRRLPTPEEFAKK